MGRVIEEPKFDYEALRQARMLENQARLKSLGVGKTVSELRKQVKEQQPPRRSYQKKVYGLTPLRRSLRISNNLTPPQSNSTPLPTPKQDKVTLSGEKKEKQRPANAPLVNLSDADLLLSSENSGRRCNSKGRGSIYNPVLGICCHFCSSICLRKRKMPPTGIAVFKAREMGYKSVAHLLMEELKLGKCK
ncbi:uncharacterized protein LOC114181656 [Vigna unguiculata]|uniref:uncharacterized protein LOC114181656 n=1 Tax=Vigna unguiculata TaxID=3917 RepID=UPI001016A299|nr:uncharacterized protein LOC114181656 [Vigna unguiculata]